MLRTLSLLLALVRCSAVDVSAERALLARALASVNASRARLLAYYENDRTLLRAAPVLRGAADAGRGGLSLIHI